MAVGLLAAGCGADTAGPSSTGGSLRVTAVTPRARSTVVIPSFYPYIVPGGVAFPPGSGLLSVGLSMRLTRDVPRAQLNVYLMTGDQASDYCGQNSPDAPAWGPLPAGWTRTYTVTGFRVYRLPCQVTAIRAMLHTRADNGLLIPPSPEETIAEATIPVGYEIDR